MVHPFCRLPLRNNQEHPTDMQNNNDESQNHYAEGKKPDRKEHPLYNSL